MTNEMMINLANIGAYSAVAFAAMGSALGTGTAGSSAIGAWKKCYAQNKPTPFQLIVFAGAPMSLRIALLGVGLVRRASMAPRV